MHRIAIAVASILSISLTSPVLAGGETIITQAKALAGNVTPGDAAGFPVTLSQPGAYVLESNLTVTPGQYGLFVTADSVDIDMNGFALSGNGGGTYGLISSFAEGRIHDGAIKAFRYSGVYLRGSGWNFEDMKIVRNGNMGIDATNARSLEVRNALISANGYSGINAGDDGLFRNNKIVQNAWIGIRCNDACHVEGNVIDQNQYGVETVSGMLIGNTITRNRSEALYDDNSIDTGLANNMFINSHPNSITQMVGGVDVHPNLCIGNPRRQ